MTWMEPKRLKFYMESPDGSRRKGDEIIILAIESSCDETSAAVVGDGLNVLSNVVASPDRFT